nr:hypothetical protein [uncultured Microbulbifer sp.]
MYNLSGDELEHHLRNRFTFFRVLNLNTEDRMPNTKMNCLFREQLKNDELMKSLFLEFDLQLDAQGYKAQKGQIVDANFIDVSK